MSNAKLAFNNRKKSALLKLPFVGNGSHWDVPKTGGYMGGCETGKALALIYLQHLKENDGDLSGRLQHIAFDMFKDCEMSSAKADEKSSARRGQVVGFFSELHRWLVGAAKHLETADGGIDALPPKQLLKAANDGLAFDEEAYLASLPDDE